MLDTLVYQWAYTVLTLAVKSSIARKTVKKKLRVYRCATLIEIPFYLVILVTTDLVSL